jgi:hypothetical protein
MQKPLGRPLVDTFITEVSQDTWNYFSWDLGLGFQAPIAGPGLKHEPSQHLSRSGFILMVSISTLRASARLSLAPPPRKTTFSMVR